MRSLLRLTNYLQDFQWLLEAVLLAAKVYLDHCTAVGAAIEAILGAAKATKQQLASAARDNRECCQVGGCLVGSSTVCFGVVDGSGLVGSRPAAVRGPTTAAWCVFALPGGAARSLPIACVTNTHRWWQRRQPGAGPSCWAAGRGAARARVPAA